MQTKTAIGPGSERDQARFYSKVALPNKQGCMLWLAGRGTDGYGQLRVAGRRPLAHRYSYELAFGPMPVGLQVDHLCRVRHCVAPAHLEVVTPKDNTLRGQGLAAKNAAKTACPQGHPYAGANLYVRPDGGRGCRKCRQRAARGQRGKQ